MTALFYQREVADCGSAITKFNASTYDKLTQILYFMGKQPQRSFDQCKANPIWLDFLKSKDLTLESPLEVISATAAQELVTRVLDDETVKKLTDNIIATIRANPGKEFNSIRVTSPFPIDETATNNNFAPALAAGVTAMLEEKMPAIFAAESITPVKVIAELDAAQTSRADAILNIVNNQRSKLYTPAPGKEAEIYMQRLVRQPVFSGKVDPNALYVPVDDFLVTQSTAISLVSYIQANGGTTTSPFCAIRHFDGAEVLTPQQESLDLLKLAINDDAKTKAGINKILNAAGLHIDFENIKGTSLSNIELLFMGGYFANGEDAAHQAAFAKAIEAIGGTVEETKGKSTHDVFKTPAGNLDELRQIFEQTLDYRLTMVDENNARFQNLITSNRAKNFQNEMRL